MQIEILHTASSLLSIFHKAFSMRKPNLINILPHRGSFVENVECNERALCKVPLCMLFFS